MNRYSVELITEITVDAADRAEAERIAEEMTVDIHDERIIELRRPYVGLIHAVSSDDDTEAAP